MVLGMRRRSAGAFVLAALLVAACGGETSSPAAPTAARPQTTAAGGAAGATAAPAKGTCTPKQVKIAVPVTPPNVVHIPPYVALDLGYFKEENLEAELIRFEGGVGSLRSAAGGSVDLAGTSSEPVITAISQGADVKVVYTYAPNVDVSFVVGPSIKTLADLKGKKIGIQEPGGFADVMSRFVLQKAGINPNDVQFVQTTTAGRVTQLVAGQVDTGVLHIDQTLGIQKQNPDIHVLANMWDVVSNYQYSVYAASTTLIKNDPNTVECMVRALMRADRALYDPAMRDKMIDIATKYTQAEKDVVAQTFDQLVKAKAWPQNDGLPRQNIEGVAKSLKDQGQLGKDVTFDQIVDLSFAQKVVQQLGRKDFPY